MVPEIIAMQPQLWFLQENKVRRRHWRVGGKEALASAHEPTETDRENKLRRRGWRVGKKRTLAWRQQRACRSTSRWWPFQATCRCELGKGLFVNLSSALSLKLQTRLASLFCFNSVKTEMSTSWVQSAKRREKEKSWPLLTEKGEALVTWFPFPFYVFFLCLNQDALIQGCRNCYEVFPKHLITFQVSWQIWVSWITIGQELVSRAKIRKVRQSIHY